MNATALQTTSTQGLALSAGDSTTIALRGFAISGFIWIYELSKIGIVQIDKLYRGNDLFSSKNNPEDIFQITAVNKGTVRIVFKQVPLWDEANFPTETNVVEIYVV
jgi:hypothetical protein